MAVNNKDAKSSEEVIWQGKTHYKFLFKYIFIDLLVCALHYLIVMLAINQFHFDWWGHTPTLIFSVVVIVICLLYIGIPIMRWQCNGYKLTDRRVIKTWGILYKNSMEIPLERIISISVERGILDRVFRCGTLHFQDSSSMPRNNKYTNEDEDSGIDFTDVPDVIRVKDLMDRVRYAHHE